MSSITYLQAMIYAMATDGTKDKLLPDFFPGSAQSGYLAGKFLSYACPAFIFSSQYVLGEDEDTAPSIQDRMFYPPNFSSDTNETREIHKVLENALFPEFYDTTHYGHIKASTIATELGVRAAGLTSLVAGTILLFGVTKDMLTMAQQDTDQEPRIEMAAPEQNDVQANATRIVLPGYTF